VEHASCLLKPKESSKLFNSQPVAGRVMPRNVVTLSSLFS